MLESISILTSTGKSYNVPNEIKNNKATINFSVIPIEKLTALDVKFTFKNAISEFRNHDYTWVKCNEDRIAGEYSPKIIKLNNGSFVQANLNIGIWEIQKSNPKVLLWRFNLENAMPLSTYTGAKNERKIVKANRKFNFLTNPALLFSAISGIEFSRSIYPFSAIVCFTDHCDFDTTESLKRQREFFKSNTIKVTKGFFLNHFSKREDNASFEKDSVELLKWKNDGHELAYHSLSQSIKSDNESFDDFYSLEPPFQGIPTWIDHGYQPYNLSLFQKNKISNTTYSDNLKRNDISTLWNYIDSGTASLGVINQLNSNDFTLNRFYQGIKMQPLKDRISIMIKNIMFHYYADEKLILKYKNAAGSFKKITHQKNLGSFFLLFRNFINISIPVLKVLVLWNSIKNKPYKLAKYTPVLFKHNIDEKEFYIFQTLEIIDFKKALEPDNIDKLIHEKGVFIAHTYFSVPLSYHVGKMFKNPNEIDDVVTANFNYLGNKIRSNEIWNPTLKELVNFWSNFEKTILDVDVQGNIIAIDASGLTYRSVN